MEITSETRNQEACTPGTARLAKADWLSQLLAEAPREVGTHRPIWLGTNGKHRAVIGGRGSTVEVGKAYRQQSAAQSVATRLAEGRSAYVASDYPELRVLWTGNVVLKQVPA